MAEAEVTQARAYLQRFGIPADDLDEVLCQNAAREIRQVEEWWSPDLIWATWYQANSEDYIEYGISFATIDLVSTLGAITRWEVKHYERIIREPGSPVRHSDIEAGGSDDGRIH